MKIFYLVIHCRYAAQCKFDAKGTREMRVLIIEDEQEMAAAVKKGLEAQGFSVDLASNGSEGLLQFDCNDYTAVLLDLNLPDMDGMEVLSAIRAQKNTPLIILSARDATNAIQQGLDEGADDYVTKPFDLYVLGSRIRAVARRSFGISRGEIAVGELVVEPARRVARCGTTALELSAKEYVILECLAQHAPDFVSAEELLSYAYDDSVDPFSSVIRVHMANIRKKLSSAGAKVEIASVKGRGYRLCKKTESSI